MQNRQKKNLLWQPVAMDNDANGACNSIYYGNLPKIIAK